MKTFTIMTDDPDMELLLNHTVANKVTIITLSTSEAISIVGDPEVRIDIPELDNAIHAAAGSVSSWGAKEAFIVVKIV